MLAADLPNLLILEQSQTAAEFAIDYQDHGIAARITFADDDQGYILAEQTKYAEANPSLGLPANTLTFSAEFSKPAVVWALRLP